MSALSLFLSFFFFSLSLSRSSHLKAVGAENQISKSAINRCHDRAQPKVLKWFNRRNINVARALMKENRLREGDTFYITKDFNWAELTSMHHPELRHCDMSGFIFLKLYNTYHCWLAHTNLSEKRRVGLICDHFESHVKKHGQGRIEAPALQLRLKQEGAQAAPRRGGSVPVSLALWRRSGGGPTGGKSNGQTRSCLAANSSALPTTRRGCPNIPGRNGAGCRNPNTWKEFIHEFITPIQGSTACKLTRDSGTKPVGRFPLAG